MGLSDEDFQYIPPEELALASMEEREAYDVYRALYAKDLDDWKFWLNTFFPEITTTEFSEAHARFYEWVWAIELGKRPTPWVSIWPRGAGKSSSLEMAVAALAARGKRKYCLLVSGTLDQAEDHVAAIATLLSHPMIARAYPEVGEPAITKEGNTKGWRRDRLVTASGFVIDALGMDSGARGAKFDDQRPDLLCLDDIDVETDSEPVTEKKIKIITHKLIPAGAPDVATLMVQNIIHPRSVFARLASKNRDGEVPRADFLKNRHVDGPYPLIENMEYENEVDENGIGHYVIKDGVPFWPERFPIPVCQELLDDMGFTAFMAECQHEATTADGDMFSGLDFASMRCAPEHVPKLKRVVVWVDPAITSTETSDCQGIQVDGLGVDNKIYRLYSWEQRATPRKAIKRAVDLAIRFNADVVGVETNQGGIIWRDIYDQCIEEKREEIENGGGDFFRKMPRYKEVKATNSTGNKVERAQRMLSDYERNSFVHVTETHEVLEAALRRFPKVKPYDLVDASVWSWNELAGSMRKRKVTTRSSAKKRIPMPSGY